MSTIDNRGEKFRMKTENENLDYGRKFRLGKKFRKGKKVKIREEH